MSRAIAYNFRQIERLRKKILDDPTMWRHYNATLTGRAFEQFVSDVGKLLGGSVLPGVLEESCMSVLGKELTRRRMNAFALRIAANVQRLRKGEVVLPWTRQVEDESAPVEVLKCWPGRNRKGDHGNHFQFLVLAGTPVGFVLERFWSNAQAHYIGAELGFSGKKVPLIHPAYLVRLRFSALFEVGLSVDRPGFHKVRLTPSLAKHNGPLMEDRIYREPGCKPKGYRHACHVCWLGYRSCRLAVHPADYQQKICDRCANPKAWHDPDDEDMDVCVECSTKIRLKPKE